MKARWLRLLLNLYPPYLGAGVKVVSITRDFREIQVRMRLRWYNRNYVGTHFGGSLYAMTDPFYMLMLIRNLGSGYEVWDQASTVRFRKPGRGTVYAHFKLTEAMLADVRMHTVGSEPYRPVWPVDVVDDDDAIIATVEKTLYVRARSAPRSEPH